MSRLWSLSDSHPNNDTEHAPAPPLPAGVEVLTVPGVASLERYESRKVRPLLQIAVRVMLWGAVALGAVGGIVGFFRSSGDDGPVAPVPVERVDVPAPVAGVAEMVVREWLTATPDDEERLASLFVEPLSLGDVDTAGMRVGRVTTIAGRPRQEDYWVVTVQAEVTEPVAAGEEDTADPAAAEDDGAPAAPEQRTTNWYLEVGIAGDIETGLVAISAPAVLPGPPQASTGWRPSLDDPEQPAAADATVQAVGGFLRALLAGDGDPERYVAPGVTVTAADPAPFADVQVESLAVDELPDGAFRVLANVWGTTVAGAHQWFSYEIVVVERVDRLEITQFSGAPTMVAGSADASDSAAASTSSPSVPSTSTTTAAASDATTAPTSETTTGP